MTCPHLYQACFPGSNLVTSGAYAPAGEKGPGTGRNCAIGSPGDKGQAELLRLLFVTGMWGEQRRERVHGQKDVGKTVKHGQNTASLALPLGSGLQQIQGDPANSQCSLDQVSTLHCAYA